MKIETCKEHSPALAEGSSNALPGAPLVGVPMSWDMRALQTLDGGQWLVWMMQHHPDNKCVFPSSPLVWAIVYGNMIHYDPYIFKHLLRPLGKEHHGKPWLFPITKTGFSLYFPADFSPRCFRQGTGSRSWDCNFGGRDEWRLLHGPHTVSPGHWKPSGHLGIKHVKSMGNLEIHHWLRWFSHRNRHFSGISLATFDDRWEAIVPRHSSRPWALQGPPGIEFTDDPDWNW